MPFLNTDRLRIHYRIHGAPDGIPMLFLHGSHASSRWWAPLFAVLPEEILAIAPDLRGCGQSEGGASRYDIGEQANDMLAFINQLKLHEIDLVGHSSGAAIAVEIALASRQHISTLTLISPVPMEGVFTPPDVFSLLEQMKTDRDLHAQAIAAMMPSLARDGVNDEHTQQDFFSQLVDDAQAMDPAAFTEVATALGRWNRFADTQQLTLPTLLVWGDQDSIVNRDEVTRTLIALPGANNLEVLRNVGHSPMIEVPLVLAERLIDFVTADYRQFDAIRDSVSESYAGPGESVNGPK